MTEAAKEARRAYKRKWNAANKDKVMAAQERFWEKMAARAQAQERPAQPSADPGPEAGA